MNQLESNKAAVRAYVDAFNARDYARLAEIYAPDAVIFGVLGWGGIDKVIPLWRQLHDGFDVKLNVESMVAEGDLVAVRYTERGTFKGPFKDQAPTGKSYEMVAMEWFELKNGKIQRRWGARDFASQAKQMGFKLG